jgi:transposase InsO family protein
VSPPQASLSTGGTPPLTTVAASSTTVPVQFPEMQWSDVPVEDRINPDDDPDCFPGSYKWLQMTTGVKWPAAEHATPVSKFAGQSPDGWLRAHNGAWQRRVVLQNLSRAPQYNGCVGWADISHLESAAGQPPRLLVVQLTEPDRTVQVSSAHVFAVGPLFRQHKPRSSLFTVRLKLHTPRGPVPVTALVDTGCELQGLVNKRFAATWDLPLSPASQSVRTATGETVSGMQQAAVQTHLAPGFSRRVEYGVLDIPGFDVILGMGFLQQCAPYQLQDDGQGQRSIRLTSPSSRRVVVLEAEPRHQLTVPPAPILAAQAHAELPTHHNGPLEMHWSAPTADEYAHIVAAFSIILDQHTAQPVLTWAAAEQSCQPTDPSIPSEWASKLASSELEEGLVFLLGTELRTHLQHVPAEMRPRLESLLSEYRDAVFPDKEFPPFPPEREVTFRIQLEDGAQIPASPVHKLSPALVEQLRKMLQELLHDGLIVPSTSPFAAPLLMIKKPDGGYRICIDYRKLNAVTVKDRYPLPNPAMIFDKLAGCTFFSKFDLRWGYFQVRVAEEDVNKTTFRSPLGSFASRVMSMGLTNAAPTFQRLMDSVFGDLDFVSCYLDDILIASRSAEEHLQHLATVLARLKQHQLLARETKCAFFMTEIKFLGYIFSAKGKAVDFSKTEALRQLPAPDTIVELQRWLGAVNYYSAFIPNFAEITAPLTDLLKALPAQVRRKSKAKLEWLPLHQTAFEAIRQALAAPPLLRIFDPKLPCKVSVDASKVALGGVLEQEEHDQWRPVAYYSRKLTPAETRYTTRERECLAVKQCLVVWRHYLLGAPFIVKSDHESLKWLQTQDVNTMSDRLVRWVEYFSLFDFDQQYIPGELNVLPDHFSRPTSSVVLSSDPTAPQQLDLIDLALLLQEHQHVLPVLPASEDAVFPDTQVHSLFYDQIVAAQNQDPEIAAIVQRLLDPVGARSSEFRTLYVVQDGVLGVRAADGQFRTVIPSGPLRAAVCRFFHDEAGHPGIQRTLQAVMRYFYWPNMSRFVAQFVSSCTSCQAAKGSNRLPAGFVEPHVLPDEPASEWSVDFLELPQSADGHNCVAVWTERISKLVVLVPMSNKAHAITALEVAKSFVDQVFCWFGVPKSILSDRGPQFRAAVWHQIWALLGTTVKHSTPHTPHSHGDVERQNRIINEMLRTMLHSQFAELLPRWNEYIKLIQFAMNNALVNRTGMTPLFFFFGRHPRVPASLDLPQTSLDPRSLEFVTAFQNRVQQALDKGKESQVQLIRDMAPRRDPTVQFRVGDQAWLRAEECPIPGNKHFKYPWTGPFTILAVTPSTATLELPEHWRLLSSTFHFDKLRPFRPRPAAVGPSIQPPPPALIQDGQAWYEVERIVKHGARGRRQRDGHRPMHYMVRFKGYSDAYNVWRPASTLEAQGCASHIAHYHQVFNIPLPSAVPRAAGGMGGEVGGRGGGV